jgi:hypothetical protein
MAMWTGIKKNGTRRCRFCQLAAVSSQRRLRFVAVVLLGLDFLADLRWLHRPAWFYRPATGFDALPLPTLLFGRRETPNAHKKTAPEGAVLVS